MLSQNRPTPLWDFPPSDLKISKSAILDFRFIDNNQEIMKMVSTIARSSSAPKLLKPKKKFIDPRFLYKTGLKTTLWPFCTFFILTSKVSAPPTFPTSGRCPLGGVHHNSELSLRKLNKDGRGGTIQYSQSTSGCCCCY